MIFTSFFKISTSFVNLSLSSYDVLALLIIFIALGYFVALWIALLTSPNAPWFFLMN